MLRHHYFIAILMLACLGISSTWARGTYQEPQAFLQETFNGDPPASKVVWLTSEIRNVVEDILGHDAPSLRIRYWQQGQRIAWILEEIGKEKPITTGIVINRDRIERVKVLVFRESRGWEVRHAFFTDQFKQAQLDRNRELSNTIDGISGATLSVRALRKLARVALFLSQQINASS